MDKKQIGILGENLAAHFLISQGYKIIAANYRFKRDEIDLIADKNGKTIFIEVKTRKYLSFGAPEESFTAKKIKSLVRCAGTYGEKNGLKFDDWQIDLIAIELNLDHSLKKIKHFENAIW